MQSAPLGVVAGVALRLGYVSCLRVFSRATHAELSWNWPWLLYFSIYFTLLASSKQLQAGAAGGGASSFKSTATER